jgi:hypothetical protein
VPTEKNNDLQNISQKTKEWSNVELKKKGKSDYDVQIDRGKYKYLNERR